MTTSKPKQNSPELLAYRVSELERSQREGFQKLESLITNYAQQQVTEAHVNTLITLALTPVLSRLQTLEEEASRKAQRDNRILGVLSTIVGSLLILLITNWIMGRP